MTPRVLELDDVDAERATGGVERAAGVLMGHFGMDRDTALHMLRTWSAQRQLDVDVVSRCVLASVSPDGTAEELSALVPRGCWLPSPATARSAADAGRLARRRLAQLIEVLDDSW